MAKILRKPMKVAMSARPLIASMDHAINNGFMGAPSLLQKGAPGEADAPTQSTQARAPWRSLPGTVQSVPCAPPVALADAFVEDHCCPGRSAEKPGNIAVTSATIVLAIPRQTGTFIALVGFC
jgi:hypothetical protein